jgi:hypothetical protein
MWFALGVAADSTGIILAAVVFIVGMAWGREIERCEVARLLANNSPQVER